MPSFLVNAAAMRRFPDYSTLPVEILRMIAHEVAKPSVHEEKRHQISINLFKLRLVCRTLSCTATSVFVALTQRDCFSDYTTIYLPPKTGSLEDLKSIFTAKDKTMSNLITKVIYQITTAQREETDEQYLVDRVCDDCDSCSCDEDSCESPRLIAARNVATFEAQTGRDDVFASALSSIKGTRALRAILTRLARLKVVRIEVEDFWEDYFVSYWGSPSENEAVGVIAYRQGLPVLLEELSKASATHVQLCGLGSYAFAGLYPLKMMKLKRAKNFLANITNFELTASRRDVVQMEEYMDEPELRPMRRADRISVLLSCFKNLSTLKIGYDDQYDDLGLGHLGDAEWLDTVLEAQVWPELKSFTLTKFHVEQDTLDGFFDLHEDLEAVVLDRLQNLDSDEWYSVLSTLHGNLSLSTATITIPRNLHPVHAELNKILSNYDKDSKSPRIDVGAYVVQRSPKVEELE